MNAPNSKNLFRNLFWNLSFLLCFAVLILSGCKSSEGIERTRPEYAYVPPVLLPTPTPVPVPVPGGVDLEAGDAAADSPRPSFFGRIFSRKDRDENEGATVPRVGDNLDVEADLLDEEMGNDQPADHIYRLKNGDTVIISLSGSGGLNEDIQTRIDDEGSVKLRFIGAVTARGLSTTELEREIQAEYTDRQKIYKDVTVRVVVPNTFYSIGGEVRQPGRFPLVGRVTLSQAVVAAGNFTEWVDERDITLVRNKERVKINFRKIRENPNLDVELLAGDVIWVGRRTW